MEKSRIWFGWLLWAISASFLSYRTAAQVVATKDFTTPTSAQTSSEQMSRSQPPTRHNGENCADSNYAIGFRDGSIVRQPPEHVQLQIVNIDPQRVFDGTRITVTVRLKNIGDQPILVPWATSPLEPDIDPKTGAKSWENVSIHLTFGTQENRNTSYLNGEAHLAATPSNRAHQTELLNGQSVEVKFGASIECYSSESWECQKLPTSGHAQLTAHWWESLTTREEEGCRIWKGNYESRMASSAPFPITYVITSGSVDKETNPSK